MKTTIIEVLGESRKAQISNDVLRDLPDWFGIEESILAYIVGCKSMPMYAIYENESAISFVSLKTHFKTSCELYVLGVLKKFHRQGLGKQLISYAEEEVRKKGVKYMTVKTLSAGRPNAFYDKTRAFYLGIGYEPLEEFETLWDESNPCLLMIKSFC